MPAAQVCQLIGGEVYSKHLLGEANNACALRVSRALNYTGVVIPALPLQTWKGADNKNYFYTAAHLYNWLQKTFGEPDVKIDAFQGGPNGTKFKSLLAGLQNQGIFMMKPINHLTFEATGHASYWGGLDVAGGHNFFPAAAWVYVWRLKP